MPNRPLFTPEQEAGIKASYAKYGSSIRDGKLHTLDTRPLFTRDDVKKNVIAFVVSYTVSFAISFTIARALRKRYVK